MRASSVRSTDLPGLRNARRVLQSLGRIRMVRCNRAGAGLALASSVLQQARHDYGMAQRELSQAERMLADMAARLTQLESVSTSAEILSGWRRALGEQKEVVDGCRQMLASQREFVQQALAEVQRWRTAKRQAQARLDIVQARQLQNDRAILLADARIDEQFMDEEASVLMSFDCTASI